MPEIGFRDSHGRWGEESTKLWCEALEVLLLSQPKCVCVCVKRKISSLNFVKEFGRFLD